MTAIHFLYLYSKYKYSKPPKWRVYKMSYRNIHILGTAIYHPENKVDNQSLIEHFDNLGIEVRGLLKHLDRKERYLILDSNEDVISMSVKASIKVMNKTDILPDDIDMLVFVSDNPQFTTPSNALIIHNKLGLKKSNIAFDLNNNCIGMITAIDFVSNYMKANNSVKNVLIVGAQMVSRFAREDDPVTYATSGDGAAAIILQSRTEDEPGGCMDSAYKVDSGLSDKMRFPACGMSNILNEDISTYDKKMLFIPHDVSYFAEEWKMLISKLLDKSNLKPKDIEHYLFSQFSHADIYSTLEKLNVNSSRHTFVANKYGYTGCTSPIFALNEAVEENKIHNGSYIVFCSVGIGFSMSSLLYKY